MFCRTLNFFRVILSFLLVVWLFLLLPIFYAFTPNPELTAIIGVMAAGVIYYLVFVLWSNAAKKAHHRKMRKYLGNEFKNNLFFCSSSHCNAVHIDNKKEIMTLFNVPNTFYSISYANISEIELNRKSKKMLIHLINCEYPCLLFLIQRRDYYTIRSEIVQSTISYREWVPSSLT